LVSRQRRRSRTWRQQARQQRSGEGSGWALPRHMYVRSCVCWVRWGQLAARNLVCSCIGHHMNCHLCVCMRALPCLPIHTVTHALADCLNTPPCRSAHELLQGVALSRTLSPLFLAHNHTPTHRLTQHTSMQVCTRGAAG
jgi:hypothetical protein